MFSRDHVKPFKFSSPTGHYTALAWAETDKVGLFFFKEVDNLSPGWVWCDLLQGREVVRDVVHVQLRAGRQLHPRRDVQGGSGVLRVSAWDLVLLRLSRLVCGA